MRWIENENELRRMVTWMEIYDGEMVACVLCEY